MGLTHILSRKTGVVGVDNVDVKVIWSKVLTAKTLGRQEVTVRRLIVDEESKTTVRYAPALLRRSGSLSSDAAEHREVMRTQVTQRADRAVPDESNKI